MISDNGRSKRCARAGSSDRGRGEVAGVEEAGLQVDPGLRLELRHRERAMDQQQRGDREGHEPGIAGPERGQDDPERGKTNSVERVWYEKSCRIGWPLTRRIIGAISAELSTTRTTAAAVPASAKRASSEVIRPSAPRTTCLAPHADIVAIVNTKMFVDCTYHVRGCAATRARAGSAGSARAAPAGRAARPRSGRRRSCGSSCCRACGRRRTARPRRSSPAARTRASRRCGCRTRPETAPSRRPRPRP